jgi:hypothetical protein
MSELRRRVQHLIDEAIAQRDVFARRQQLEERYMTEVARDLGRYTGAAAKAADGPHMFLHIIDEELSPPPSAMTIALADDPLVRALETTVSYECDRTFRIAIVGALVAIVESERNADFAKKEADRKVALRRDARKRMAAASELLAKTRGDLDRFAPKAGAASEHTAWLVAKGSPIVEVPKHHAAHRGIGKRH